MLVILQLLHEEPAIGSCIASFLGAWAPALRVVIAEKPRIIKESKNIEDRNRGVGEQDSGNGSGDDASKSEEAARAPSGVKSILYSENIIKHARVF